MRKNPFVIGQESREASLTDVLDFLERSRELYPRGVAQNLSSALVLVGELVKADDATVGYLVDHLNDLMSECAERNAIKNRRTLSDYAGRIRRSLRDFEQYRSSSKWIPSVRPSRASRLASFRASMRSSPPRATQREDVSRALPQALESTPKGIRISMPLRPEFDAVILLPSDFNQRDARRIRKVIESAARWGSSPH